jgi:hypothetical protein
MTYRRAMAVSVVVALGAGVLGLPAGAATPKGASPGFSAVWQYVEEVPTAGGPTIEQGGDHSVTKLPPKVQQQLTKSISSGSASSSTDRVLRKVGTLAAYGAPAAATTTTTTTATTTTSTSSGVRVVPVKQRPAAHSPTRIALPALTAASPSWFDARLVGLILVMGAMMALALAHRLTKKGELLVPDPVRTAEREKLERERRRMEREHERRHRSDSSD